MFGRRLCCLLESAARRAPLHTRVESSSVHRQACLAAHGHWTRSSATQAHSRTGPTSEEACKQLIEHMQADAAFAAKILSSLDAETLARIRRGAADSKDVPAGTRNVPIPSSRKLRRLALRQAVPFVAFGFFDNMVMICVGDAIDSTFGVAFGFSTMAAAGFGQMASDSVGITLQGIIERCADRLGLPDPGLTSEQVQLPLCKTVTQLARIVGILIGCFFGMCPLLFIDANESRVVDKLLTKLPSDKRSEFWSAVETVKYKEGEKILSYGSPGEHLYIVTSGSVEVLGRDASGRPMHACELGPGSFIGELEFISNEPCCADVIASSAVRVQRLSQKDFLRIVGHQGLELLGEGLIGSRYTYYRMAQTNYPARTRVHSA